LYYHRPWQFIEYNEFGTLELSWWRAAASFNVVRDYGETSSGSQRVKTGAVPEMPSFETEEHTKSSHSL
jgi:hypothetical protein